MENSWCRARSRTSLLAPGSSSRAEVVVPFSATVERRRAPDGHEHHELLRRSAARTGMVLWVVLAPVALGMALVYDPNTPMVLRAVLAVASVAVAVAGLRFAMRRW